MIRVPVEVVNPLNRVPLALIRETPLVALASPFGCLGVGRRLEPGVTEIVAHV
jgi:hypothetical protein